MLLLPRICVVRCRLLKTVVSFNCCRYLSSTHRVLKKGKHGATDLNSSVEWLKKESPFLFKAVKNLQHLDSSGTREQPLIFQPITASADELKDDHSDIYKELRISSHKKETVFIIQPNFKWGKERFLTKLAENRLAEAEALINSVHSWNVHSSCTESVHDCNPKLFFGSGKVVELSAKIRELINEHGVTMVFLNTGCLDLRQIKELEASWGCKVFDRYRVVLELFKERAQSKEAKLQVQLAEIHYLRTHLTSDDLHYDQQRGGGKGRFGSGETQMEKMKRQLSDAESKIKKSLTHIKSQRTQAIAERVKKNLPQVALVGYTNAGKTTLAKVLSHDDSMQPEDKLFATLDTTAHRGKLPSGLNLVYIDTVGFISDLPHELVESFSTTLEDVKSSDLLIHVSDCSNPEYEVQKNTVDDVLEKLRLPQDLIRNMIHVRNKIDRLHQSNAELENTESSVSMDVSATKEIGLDRLRHCIEEKILHSSGRTTVQVNIDQSGEELSWLYRHGTVLNTIAHDNGSLDIIAILDEAARGKFEKQFHVKLKY